jgi:ABC-type glutathione transport system ATPase component
MINATMLGLSPREARRRFDEVIDFAELHEFVDLKLKNYSSGMMVRLAFAVMIQVDASILLIDEVLAVGDAAFQQKCFDEFARIRRDGRTVLLVTHDMAAVRRFCDRALLLEHGEMVEEGEPMRVGNRYLELNFSAEARAQLVEVEEVDEPEEHPDEPKEDRYGDRRAEILEAWFEHADGRRATSLETGERCSFCARVRFAAEVEDPLFGMNLHNGRDDNVLSASNVMGPPSGRFGAGDEVVFRIVFHNVFAADRYLATPAVAQSGSGLQWLDRRERFASIVVTSTRETDAVTDLDYEVVLERGAGTREVVS